MKNNLALFQTDISCISFLNRSSWHLVIYWHFYFLYSNSFLWKSYPQSIIITYKKSGASKNILSIPYPSDKHDLMVNFLKLLNLVFSYNSSTSDLKRDPINQRKTFWVFLGNALISRSRLYKGSFWAFVSKGGISRKNYIKNNRKPSQQKQTQINDL